MISQNKKLVIFDFDGVLADTHEFCYSSHKNVNKDLTWEKFKSFSDGNFINKVISASNYEAHVIPPDFKEKYKDYIEKINIHDSLDKLIFSIDQDYLLVVVSSSDTNFINNFLLKENLRDSFSDILGTDVHVSKIIKINNLLEKYNILPKDAVFITDSLGDILEANQCNVKSIGVTWGIHGRENLEKGNPIAVIDNPNELLDLIKKVLK